MNANISKTISNMLKNDRSRYAIVTGITALTLLTAWAINDRRRWKSLDTGGTAPTWAGYLRMTRLRIIRLFVGGSLHDHHPLRHDGPKYLRDSIEPRQSPRPKIREWTLPQRQESLPIDPEVHTRIFSWTEKYAIANTKTLDYNLSKTEGLSAPAVYAKSDLSTRNLEAKDSILGNEIFHAHAEDGSLHVWLSEADAKTVVSRGWGERFPVSVIGITHPGWTFVYAPRTMKECDIVEEIIVAAIEYITGQKPA